MINNIKVYGLEESIKASTYPMRSDLAVEKEINMNTVKKLARCESGTGHDCFLKGITVQCDITAPQYWWPQFQRYHFADIISSQSKMHCLLKMDIDKQCNELVREDAKNILRQCIDKYNKGEAGFEYVLSNTPMGLELTARITTNYLQLKSIYKQRKNHRLQMWNTEFVEFIKSLPKNYLITG